MAQFRSVFVLVALILISAKLSAQGVVSDFATDLDGWTAPNSKTPGFLQYSATGGNPNGYVFAQSPGSVVLGSTTLWFSYFFEAPAKFEGNKSTFYGGNLRFDASQTTTGVSTQQAVVVLTNVAGSAIYFYPSTLFQPPAFGSWATFDIPLSAASGEWKTADASTGPPATQLQVQNMLANIQTLQIQGLYRNANMVTRIDNVTMYPPITVPTQPSSTAVCDGQTATFTGVGGNNPSLTYQWQFLTAFAGWVDISNTGGYSNVTTTTLSVNTTGNFGAGNYRVRISGVGVDDQFSNAALLTINPVPTAPGASGASACGPASLTMTATGGSAGNYRWYTALTGGTAIPGQTAATYITGTISTTTNYYVTIINGTCESTPRTLAIATINTIPGAPGVTGAAGCIPAAVTLSASGGTAGQYRWYTGPTGGTAIAGQTNNTYLTPVLSTTTNYYVSIDNGLCEGSRSTVVATMTAPPTAPTVTGGSGCNPGTVTLSASGGTAGQYRWYTVLTGGTAIPGETNNTYVTPVLTTTTNYYVAIDNGTCVSTRTVVVATINTPPTAPTVTGASGCSPASVTLTANGGTAGQYRWYTVSSGGTAIPGQTNSTYATPVLSTTTNYYVSIDNGTCESTRTLVIATINTPPTAPTTTGSSLCGPGTVTLTAAGGTAGQYRWVTVPSGGVAIAGQTNSTYTTPSISTTTNYYAAIDNGTCVSTRTLVVATINTPPTAPTVTGASGCSPASVTLTANGGTAGQYRWYTVSSGGIAIAGQTNSTYATPVLSTTTNYYVSIDNSTCESTRTMVVATMNTPPTAPTTTGSALCGPGTVTLTAAGGTAGQYRWFTVPSGGVAIAGQTSSTYTTPSISTTTNYYAAIDNGTCVSTRTLVVATIDIPPAAPTVTGAAGCNPSSVTLTANGGTAGQYRWYTVLTGGTAIPGETNNTYVTPVLTTTTNYYVAIDNGTCVSTRTLVVATINTPPTAPTVTGASGCSPASVTLTANGGTAGQYRWYTVSSGGTAIPGQTNSTYATPVLSTTTNYYVSIDNGTCESTRTLVIATINTPPTAPTTTGNSLCGPGTVTLTAAGGTAGQYRWFTVPSGGVAIAGQTNSTYTTPSISTTTNYYAAIDNSICVSTRTLVVATINTPPTAPTVTGASGCSPASVTLTANGGTAGQYRWYTVPSGGIAIAGQTNSTYATPVLSTTTNYYVAIDNSTCVSTRTLVVATINTPPTAPTTTGNSLCGPGTVTLAAAGGSAGQYRWYTISSGGIAIAGQTNSTYTTPSISTTTNYYAAIDNGTCISTRTLVVATINTPPAAPTVTGAADCSPAIVKLSASDGTAGQYRWYTVPSGGTAIVGETNDTYTTPILSTTTNYYVSINNGTCEGARTVVVATLSSPPAAPVATGGSACELTSATLTASGAAAGEYRWYTTQSGGADIAGAVNDTYDTPALSATTTFYVAINNGCESLRTAVVATMNPLPAPPTTTGALSCVPASMTLTAHGASDGQYRWYTILSVGSPFSGGSAINGTTGSTFATPVISVTTTYFVSINNGTCESSRTAVTATIGGSTCDNNTPPVIETTVASTTVGGKIVINLKDLISDTDDNLVLSTLTIVSPPPSGASATIDGNFNLVIDYSGESFSGTENVSISVCDAFSACTVQVLSIEVASSIEVYNGVSPNKDGKNDTFIIDGIDKLEDTKKNRVLIFNRWGDMVWEGSDYNNTTVVFGGLSKNNVELPTGTYFYKIEFSSGKKTETGYLSLKR